MASTNVLFRVFQSKNQYSFAVSGNQDASSSKSTKDGRKCSQSHRAAASEVVYCTTNKTSGKTLFSRQVKAVVPKSEYQSVVETMIKRHDELPAWDQHGGKTRFLRMKQNERSMHHLATDLLSAGDRKNKKKVQAVCDQLSRDVSAQLAERESEQENKPKSILKPANAPASTGQKTVTFASDVL